MSLFSAKRKPDPKTNALGESLDCLTEEGDLPFGWFTATKSFTDKVKNEYNTFLSAWIASRRGTPLDQYCALKSFVVYMNDIKLLCESKGECFVYWRDELFTDGYLDERSKELTDIKQNIAELESLYQAKQEFEKIILPTLEKSLMQIIESEPGILQKDVYKMFSPEAKSYIQEKLYCAEKSNNIVREKSGNSYKLYTK